MIFPELFTHRPMPPPRPHRWKIREKTKSPLDKKKVFVYN